MIFNFILIAILGFALGYCIRWIVVLRRALKNIRINTDDRWMLSVIDRALHF